MAKICLFVLALIGAASPCTGQLNQWKCLDVTPQIKVSLGKNFAFQCLSKSFAISRSALIAGSDLLQASVEMLCLGFGHVKIRVHIQCHKPK